jgi:chloramphenicol-sensitive protein RarD
VNPGYLFAAAAFILWGVLPVYWKLLDGVPPTQLVAHRVVWSLATLVPLVWWTGTGSKILAAAGDSRVLLRQAVAAFLVSANWLAFVWAVANERLIEASLGYFLNPLLSVLVGVMLLGERLRPAQWLAIALAAAGVGWLCITAHRPPWIALVLAGSFCLYSLAKKTTPLDAVSSLTLETLVLVPLATAFLGAEHAAGRGAFSRASIGTDALIAASGIVTAVPLLCFAAAARRIPLSALGFMQYLGPSLQFLLGLLVYGEPFDARRFTGFALVWTALAGFVIDGLRGGRGAAAVRGTPGPGRAA